MTKEEALEFVADNKIDHFIETSAKSNENISEAFMSACQIVISKMGDQLDVVSIPDRSNLSGRR